MNGLKKPTMINALLLLAVAALACFHSPPVAWSQESQCATVKIEIMRELTLERQAFDAHMQIKNGLMTLPVEL